MDLDQLQCITFKQFFDKYELLGCLGMGVYAMVIRIAPIIAPIVAAESKTSSTSISSARKTYAAKILCLNESAIDEYKISMLITKYKDILHNVTTLHDCALLDTGEFKTIWKENLAARCPSNESNPIHSCRNRLLLALVYDEITTTLDELTSPSNIGRIIDYKPYHVFELYYVILNLLNLNIMPSDLHYGNIGFINISDKDDGEAQSLEYNICGCMLRLSPGLHMRLIDYGMYGYEPESLGEIKHGLIVTLLHKIILYLNLNMLPKDVILVWELILRTDSEMPAQTVLFDIAHYILGCQSIEQSLEESKVEESKEVKEIKTESKTSLKKSKKEYDNAVRICPSLIDRYYLWDESKTFSPPLFRSLSKSEIRKIYNELAILPLSLRVGRFPYTYYDYPSGFDAYLIDLLRSISEDELKVIIESDPYEFKFSEFIEKAIDNFYRLPLLQQIEYESVFSPDYFLKSKENKSILELAKKDIL